MPETPGAVVQSLYVHVPFCAQKCSYCAFFSEPSSPEVINRYVRALVRELEMVTANVRAETIFFGGGTPSLLNLQQWELLLKAMDRLGMLGAAEWTIECNPATVSLDKARLLRDHGVNRISMGVQSLDNGLLERLGRIHTREMAFKSYDLLRKAGFENVNLDLMFGIPGQTMEAWRSTLAEAVAMASEHLACYEVIYEEDTPLFEQLQAGKARTDEDLACAMYDEFVNRAEQAGFVQYEIANFAKSKVLPPHAPNNQPQTTSHPQEPCIGEPHAEVPAYACQHNVNYWRGGSFYGLGPSATSYIHGVRAKNWSNTPIYCEQLESGNRPIESEEELPPLSRAGETAAFGLRMVSGWSFKRFQQVTGQDLRQGWAEEMKHLIETGWGEITEETFRLTPKGLRFADAAARMFLK